LWNWAAKFRRDDEAKAVESAAMAIPQVPPAEDARAKADSIPLAKVVRVPRQDPAGKPSMALLSVELFGIRIAVPMGFDRPTFAMVLDEIEARRARLGQR
jgi:hypothetical protein